MITTGSQNVLLGADTDPSANDGTNQTVVGYGATGQANNSVTLGNADVTTVYMAQDAGATIHAAGITSASNGTITIDPNGSGTLALGSADNTAATVDAIAFSIDATGGASNISLAADGAADDLTVAVTGSQDASLVLSSAGTGADAVQLTASAGGMDVTSAGAMDITTSAGNTNITIDPNGSGTLALGSADNTAATVDAIAFSIDATGGASNISLAADGAADDLTVAVTGSQDASLVLSSAGTGADAVQLTASAGGMDISASSGVDFNASKIDNYSANVETGSPSGNALAIDETYNGTVLLIEHNSAVQTLTLADDLPVGFNFMVVQKGDYKIKMAAATTTDLVGQGITSGNSGYIWSNGKYSVITIVVIADGKYVMTGDRSNSAS